MKPHGTSNDLTLRRAQPADLAVVLPWSPSRELLHQWAGPSCRWPTSPEMLWEDINNADATSFALESAAHGLVAFGQIRHREKTFGHLARLIVSPHHRGRGYGRELCLALMHEAPALHPIREYSLYVWRDNTAAHALYRSLGFVEAGTHPGLETMLLMIAPLSNPSRAARVNAPHPPFVARPLSNQGNG